MNSSGIDCYSIYCIGQPFEGVEYTCGACRTVVTLKPQEAIQCRNCGHRILYKIRTNAPQQLEAR